MSDTLPAVDTPPERLECEHPRNPHEDLTVTGPPTARINRWHDLLAAPRIALPLLVAFSLILLVVNLGGYPIYTKGEPREAIRILDVMHGSWMLPTQDG